MEAVARGFHLISQSRGSMTIRVTCGEVHSFSKILLCCFSSLAVLTISTIPTNTVAGAAEIEQCADVADRAILGAIRVIGKPDYSENRALLKTLGCSRLPEERSLICARLTQHAAHMGVQGTPGYWSIRHLMRDMGCQSAEVAPDPIHR